MSARRGRQWLLLAGGWFVLLGCLSRVEAAASVDVISVDLTALIDDSARYPNRFAVEVPHTVSVSSQGQWSTSGPVSTWRYSARLPSAASMSFHAPLAALPPSAVLTVTGESSNVTYRPSDVSRGGLWARPLAGDTLSLSLSVNNTDMSKVRLQITGFQAGYRGLGGNVPDHPHYSALLASASSATALCTENYSCHAASGNQGPAQATVALVVGNTTQCTGTLVADTSSDNAPYVLTARHCESGMLGGGDPDAAASVAVYWDAVTACGTTLGSIYDSEAIVQYGATTVVEQQDTWLIRLDAPPAATDAYYSGWDATGATFVGGYSVHHALGHSKQYTAWSGQAILLTVPGSTLKIGYASTFWGVVNSVGSIGAGASGGALFSPDNRLVGSSTLAELANGPNTGGVCPVVPTAVPSQATVTGQYTSLASVWSSTEDTTSKTGNTTLQSALDPARTGQLTTQGFGFIPATLRADANSLLIYQNLTLTWSTVGAQTCTASGGVQGDGWAGTRAGSGSWQLTETVSGDITYRLQCSNGSSIGSANVTTSWIYQPDTVVLSGVPAQTTAGSTVQLSWHGIYGSCMASGGTADDGWTGSLPLTGTQQVTSATAGPVIYVIQCSGPGGQAQGQTLVTYVPVTASNPPTAAPTVTLSANPTDPVAGASTTLTWVSQNSSACTAAGGNAGDGWSGNLPVSGSMSVTEANAGAVNYSIACTGAAATAAATAKLTVNFSDASPTTAGSSSSGGATGGGGSGGGGAVDPLWLLVLTLPLARRTRRVWKSARKVNQPSRGLEG
jgi:lysyl endopeptidase